MTPSSLANGHYRPHAANAVNMSLGIVFSGPPSPGRRPTHSIQGQCGMLCIAVEGLLFEKSPPSGLEWTGSMIRDGRDVIGVSPMAFHPMERESRSLYG